MEFFQKSVLTASISYSIANTFVKLSLLCFYLRLSPEKGFRTAVYTMIVICGTFGIACILIPGLQCRPLSMLWDPQQTGYCIDVESFYFANLSIHIATEIGIFILPVRTLWRLQLPLRQRIGLCVLLGMGGVYVNKVLFGFLVP
jgi:hypothetical protein